MTPEPPRRPSPDDRTRLLLDRLDRTGTLAIGPSRTSGIGWIALGIALLVVLVGGFVAAWRSGQTDGKLVLLCALGLALAGWVTHWGLTQRRENRDGVVLDAGGIHAGTTLVPWTAVESVAVRDVGHGSSTILQVEVTTTAAVSGPGPTSEAARVAARLGVDLGRRVLLPRGLTLGPRRLRDLLEAAAESRAGATSRQESDQLPHDDRPS